MNWLRRRFRRGAPIPFNRLTAIALVGAALLPATILGVLTYAQVQRALADDAVVRTERAMSAATMHVAQAQGDLDALARSYATWPVFERMVAAGQLAAVHDEVVGFLVDQGTTAAGRVDTATGSVTAGDAAVAEQLAAVPMTSPGVPTVIDVRESVYLVTSQAITSPDTPTQSVGRITLARRMDAMFVAGLATLTGFAVSIVGPDGLAYLATDPDTAHEAVAATAGSNDVIREGDIVARRTHIAGPLGGADLALSSQVSALQATASRLPILILALLIPTALFALLLAWLVARILRRRLGVVHDGLAAIADGRVPPASATRQNDDIARVAAGLDRLVATLDRREAVLRRCLAAAAAVPISLSAPEAGRALARAATDIFGLAWVRILEPDGTALATARGAPLPQPSEAGAHEAGSPAPAAPAAPAASDAPKAANAATVEAPAGLGLGDRRLEAGLRPNADWTDGDQAGLEVMALLAGSVIAEAEQYGEAANRADRLDRVNRLQREFLRGVSHNLRAPLATIELAASDLLDAKPNPYVRLRAEAIQVEERRLARLVTQVLLLSRMESGMLELEGEPVALAPLARRVAAELGLADRVGLAERAAGAVAITDEPATEQVVWILLDNAGRYAPEGSITVEILPAGTAIEPAIVLAVQDEGPGILPGDERHIFRRFARGASSEGTEGSGVGLSVARGLARALGGDVVYVRTEIGARFEVTLPSSGPAEDAELGPSVAGRSG